MTTPSFFVTTRFLLWNQCGYTPTIHLHISTVSNQSLFGGGLHILFWISYWENACESLLQSVLSTSCLPFKQAWILSRILTCLRQARVVSKWEKIIDFASVSIFLCGNEKRLFVALLCYLILSWTNRRTIISVLLEIAIFIFGGSIRPTFFFRFYFLVSL